MSWKPFVPSNPGTQTALVWLFGMLAALPYRSQAHSGLNDEALVIHAARRMLSGEIPYRDFDMLYTPGSMILTAIWLAFTGESYDAARWLMVVCGGALAASIFLVSRQVLPAALCWVPATLFAISGYSEWPILNYHWFAIIGLLLCSWQTLLWQRNGLPLHLLLSGVACGSAALCLQSEGVACVLAVFSILALGRNGEPWPERTRNAIIFIAGIVAIWLPFLFVLLAVGATGAFIDNTILRVLGGLYHYHAGLYDIQRHVVNNWSHVVQQWPSDWDQARLFWALETVTTVAVWTFKYALFFPVIAVVTVLGFRQRGPLRGLALFLFFWTFMMRERLDLLYSNYLMPLWYIAATACFSALLFRHPRLGRVALRSLGVLYSLMLIVAWRYCNSFIYPIPTPGGVLWSRSAAEATSFQQLYSTTSQLSPPGSTAFAWPFVASFYVLSQTTNPTRIDFVTPGWQTTDQIQAAVQALSNTDYLYYFPLNPEFVRDYPNLNPEAFRHESEEFLKTLTQDFEPYTNVGAASIYRRRAPTTPL